MNRRGFIGMSALGLAGSILVPKSVLASTKSGMAGGVYYTKEAPGRWSQKIGGHMPVVEVSGKTVKVTTPHEMRGYEHYIVKHMVLDADYQFIAEKMFDPAKDTTPFSEYELADYSGKIYVLSVCNKHDTWLASAEV